MQILYVCVCICINAQNCLDDICPKWVMLKTVKPSLNSDLETTKKLKKKKKRKETDGKEVLKIVAGKRSQSGNNSGENIV